jgi:hypothetical protein
MKRTLLRFTGLAVFAAASLVIASAAEFEGVLMDQACAADSAKDGQKAALKHDKDCALMAACVKSGYGIITADDKYIKLDQGATDKVVAALKKTDKADNLKVKVSGELSGDTITVTSITII